MMRKKIGRARASSTIAWPRRPSSSLANHQLSTVIVVVRHGRNSPAVMLCETTV